MLLKHLQHPTCTNEAFIQASGLLVLLVTKMTPWMCPLPLRPIHILLKPCPFRGPETSLRKDGVSGMAEIFPSYSYKPKPLQTILTSQSPTTLCHQPPTACSYPPVLSLLGNMSGRKAGIVFSFSATWGSGQSPSVKQLE